MISRKMVEVCVVNGPRHLGKDNSMLSLKASKREGERFWGVGLGERNPEDWVEVAEECAFERSGGC